MIVTLRRHQRLDGRVGREEPAPPYGLPRRCSWDLRKIPPSSGWPNLPARRTRRATLPRFCLRWKAGRNLVNCSMRHVFGVDARTGALLWTRPMQTRYLVIASTPVLVQDAVFATAPDTEQATLYRFQKHRGGAQCHQSLDHETGYVQRAGLISIGDSIFGAWYRQHGGRGFGCLDARDRRSEILHQGPGQRLAPLRRRTALLPERRRGRWRCSNPPRPASSSPAGFSL